MTRMQFVGIAFFLLLGTLMGLLFLVVAPTLPLRFDSPLYRVLGIRKPQIIGFLPYWLLPRYAGPGHDQINVLTYFGLTVGDNGNLIQFSSPVEEEPGWTALDGDRMAGILGSATASGVKLSLLVHNSNEESIAKLIADPETHARNLVAEAAPIMRKYGFSDLNLDIESFRESTPSSQSAYTTFVRTVKAGLDQHRLGTLTVEVTPISLHATRMIDVGAIGQIADTVVLMAYDFHYSGSYLAGPVAPATGSGTVRDLDIAGSIRELVRVVPPEKAVLGIPLYGYEWETVQPDPGSPVIPGTGKTASVFRVESEITPSCTDCIIGYDEIARTPYIIRPSGDYYEQIFTENSRSVSEKIKLAQSYGLGGVAFWALGYEGTDTLTPLRDYGSSYLYDPPFIGAVPER